VIRGAGSRYTYSANTLAYGEAIEAGSKKIALVGMSCQSSIIPVAKSRKIGKVANRFALNIGLLCSKSFDEAIFEELFEQKYGLDRRTIKKTNIKGVFQIWTHDGGYYEINLKECHAWTREGCNNCPDFAAEHADISTGGIGNFSNWTLTIVRTAIGREIIMKMLEDGSLIGRPGDDDPGAIALMHKLSEKSRKRWPDFASPKPALLPIPTRK
jgi:coenzyme F420 hydrogenase subunit beta